MKENYLLQHKTALLNPYGSIVQVLDGDPDKLLVGIKNDRSIPNTLMHKLEPAGFTLHTIDKKSQLAGRAVDTQPVSYTHLKNVFCLLTFSLVRAILNL